MTRSTRLAGHTLPNEGDVRDAHGYKLRAASTQCSCGEQSPILSNTAQRRKWHAEHKAAILAAQTED